MNVSINSLLISVMIALMTSCNHDETILLQPLAGISLEVAEASKSPILPDDFTAQVEVYVNKKKRHSKEMAFERSDLYHYSDAHLEVPVEQSIVIRMHVTIDGEKWEGESYPFSVYAGYEGHEGGIYSVIIYLNGYNGFY